MWRAISFSILCLVSVLFSCDCGVDGVTYVPFCRHCFDFYFFWWCLCWSWADAQAVLSGSLFWRILQSGKLQPPDDLVQSAALYISIYKKTAASLIFCDSFVSLLITIECLNFQQSWVGTECKIGDRGLWIFCPSLHQLQCVQWVFFLENKVFFGILCYGCVPVV